MTICYIIVIMLNRLLKNLLFNYSVVIIGITKKTSNFVWSKKNAPL